MLVATFDTASEMPRWFPVGSAARPASRRLSKLGLESIAAPEHFFVHGKYGPVCDGEVERAAAWGAGMRAALAEAA